MVNRPLGSSHPNYPDLIYQLNYGFIPDTLSGDGEALDAYILGVDYPVEEFEGYCVAYIQRLEEDDDKLIVVPVGYYVTDSDIKDQTKFVEKYYKSRIMRQ